MTPERLEEIRNRYTGMASDAYSRNHTATHAVELVAEVYRLRAELNKTDKTVQKLLYESDERLRLLLQAVTELNELRPWAEAGKQAALEHARHEYEHGSCDGCLCCTTAQCAEQRCPTDSIGDSVCPCTCY